MAIKRTSWVIITAIGWIHARTAVAQHEGQSIPYSELHWYAPMDWDSLRTLLKGILLTLETRIKGVQVVRPNAINFVSAGKRDDCLTTVGIVSLSDGTLKLTALTEAGYCVINLSPIFAVGSRFHFPSTLPDSQGSRGWILTSRPTDLIWSRPDSAATGARVPDALR